jgi:putative transposase
MSKDGKVMSQQLALGLESSERRRRGPWGGHRQNAGRKPGPRRNRRVPHRARARLASRYPVHVSLKLRREMGHLRAKNRMRVIRQAFVASCSRKDFRIIDWSVQGTHMHLIVEATNATALARGMQGFSSGLARRLNNVLGRKGPVLADRYYTHILRTPREVRHARAYVMLNARRHVREASEAMGGKWIDPCSSWAWFDGWRDLPEEWLQKARAGPGAVAPVAEPQTWLLQTGWRRHGLVRLVENPGGFGRPDARASD